MSRDLRLGAHLRVADEGLAYTVATARGMCLNEMQILTGKERDYEPWEIEEGTIDQFRKMTYEMKLTVHLPYMLNPCEGNSQRKGFYKHTVKRHLKMAEALGAKRAVLHPGFKKDLTEPMAFRNLIAFIEGTWSSDTPVELLLETDSGSKNGSAIGSSEFIKEVAKEITGVTVRMCLDTEHLYARGIDLWDPDVRKAYLDEYGDLISLVHLNVPDHEVQLGSFLDRHNTAFEDRADWDHQGFLEDFSRFPMILERRSLFVVQRDNLYVRLALGQQLERQRA